MKKIFYLFLLLPLFTFPQAKNVYQIKSDTVQIKLNCCTPQSGMQLTVIDTFGDAVLQTNGSSVTSSGTFGSNDSLTARSAGPSPAIHTTPCECLTIFGNPILDSLGTGAHHVLNLAVGRAYIIKGGTGSIDSLNFPVATSGNIYVAISGNPYPSVIIIGAGTSTTSNPPNPSAGTTTEIVYINQNGNWRP